MGNDNITPDMISNIAKDLGFNNFLHTMPAGYDTLIDPLGKKLPTSLIKKILLLRALVNNPNLLLLEEPWQGFDENLSSKIMHYLLQQVQNATILVVTNSTEFASQCDYQIELQNGILKMSKNN